MKLALAAAILLLLLGCEPHATNDEVIRETKKCEAAGMVARRMVNFDGSTSGIACVPKGE